MTVTAWFALYKKWSFPLRNSSVNKTKSAGNPSFFVMRWSHNQFPIYWYQFFSSINMNIPRRTVFNLSNLTKEGIAQFKLLERGKLTFLLRSLIFNKLVVFKLSVVVGSLSQGILSSSVPSLKSSWKTR